MIPGLSFSLADLTPVGLVVLCFLAIVFGILVPVRYYKQVVAQLDHERATTEMQRKTIDSLTKSVEKFTEGTATMESIMAALQKNARESK